MKNRTIFAGLCLLILFSACSKSPKLKIEGTISNAEGKMLYFEFFGINKTETLDSVKLNEKGSFKFKTKLPDSPEFYKLRLGERFIQLGADSSATVVIEADGKSFGKAYSVKGSTCCQLIKDLSMMQNKTLISIDSLHKLYSKKQLSDTTFQIKLDALLNAQRDMAKKVIFDNPRSPAAYFALFLRLYNLPIFDPYNKDDNKCYAAVGTAWNTYYPKADRSKNLVNLTLQGLKEIRSNRPRKNIVVREQDKISYFEIGLPNIYDKVIPLSSQVGKVILLDFTAYQSKFSPSRNLHFRDLYNKYNQQGFEIYQVSLDVDENFWKTSAANLPWVCVRDKNSIRSTYLTTYNVQEIPTYFLMDRKGNIVARDVMISDLNKEILKLL